MTTTIATGNPRLTEEPPDPIDAEILWRLAVRQFREHTAAPAGRPPAPWDAPWVVADVRVRCDRCGQPWPCSGRRMAELGLRTARRSGARRNAIQR